MKRANTSPLSSPQPVRHFFVDLSVPRQTSVDAASTPKMNCVIDSVLSSNRTSYYGTFQSLDNQNTFDLEFGTNPIPFTLFFSHKVAKDDFLRVLNKSGTYVSTCQIIFFFSIVEEQYIGTCNYESRSMPRGVTAVISKLKLDFTRRSKGVGRTLDDLFRGYMKYIPLLPVTTN